MSETLFVFLTVLFIGGFAYLLSIQESRVVSQPYIPKPPLYPSPDPLDFVPVEDHVVPTQPYHSNKFNDELGAKTTALAQPGPAEVVVPSDWFYWPYLPTEYSGSYWPRGSIEPDYIFPGSDPKRPLRSPRQSSQRGVDVVAV
jgi:hypothetical protein